MPPFLVSLLVTLFTIGPEKELAPSTTFVRFDGDSAALGASNDGFLSVWHSWDAHASFFRRLDASGRAVDPVGVRLPVELTALAAAWNGSEFVVAGHGNRKMVVMRAGGEAREVADTEYASQVTLTFNGSVLLLTWSSQTGLTQTMHALLLEADLDVIGDPFIITTRDVSGFTAAIDRSTSRAVAATETGFVVSWEAAPALMFVSATGEVTPGATLGAEKLQPTVVATSAGLLLLWHDRTVIHAQRIAADGSPLEPSVDLVRSERIHEIAAAGKDAELAVSWRAMANECDTSTLFARRFDASFAPVGETSELSTTSFYGIALAAGPSVLASWIDRTCDTTASLVRTSAMSEPAETISAFVAPSAQLDPDVASDGTSALAIWSEARDAESATRIFGAILDSDGNVQRSLDIARGEHGRVAFGDGRYLVAWRHASTIAARFLDGEVFAVAASTSPFELGWNGEQFVFIWNEGSALRSAFVSSCGFMIAGPSLEDAGSLADVIAGPHGEIAALYRVETSQQVDVRVATLRTEWYVEETLATAARPCGSFKRCLDYIPLALGWNGNRYVAVWKMSEGAPLGGFIESRVVHGGTTRIAAVYNYSGNIGGELAWTGSAFVLTLLAPGVSASWPVTYVVRVNESGAPIGSMERLSATEASSLPALALLRPDRAVVVYNRQLGLSQRVVARTIRLTDPPRRRAARH